MNHDQKMNHQRFKEDGFPKRRNGVVHAAYGTGTCIIALPIEGPNRLIKFKDMQRWVPADELTPCPSKAESPDPATSRNSGWVSGGYAGGWIRGGYAVNRDLRVKGGLLSRKAVQDIESNETYEPSEDAAPKM